MSAQQTSSRKETQKQHARPKAFHLTARATHTLTSMEAAALLDCAVLLLLPLAWRQTLFMKMTPPRQVLPEKYPVFFLLGGKNFNSLYRNSREGRGELRCVSRFAVNVPTKHRASTAGQTTGTNHRHREQGSWYYATADLPL